MTTPEPPLSEKDFIHEGYSQDPYPLWLWLFLFTLLIALLWGGSSWYQDKLGAVIGRSPFLQVTNREISLFLWQNPEYMRNNAKEKSAYLPGFQYIDKITLDLAQADQYAVAPPELIFRYHVWDRLIKEEFNERPISKGEFIEFLSYAEEWHPQYWTDATTQYAELVKRLPRLPEKENLADLSHQDLPLEVRMAFQGWKNYFKEGKAINQVKPTYAEMETFLSSHPHYARNYWRNIVEDVTPNYLKSIGAGIHEEKGTLASDELSAFLRAAFYNYSKAQKNQ